jgi:hypothetical protein
MTIKSSAEIRERLRNGHRCRFVSPAEFCRLLLSRRRFVRSDVHGANLKGLFDPATGMRFFVEADRLVLPLPVTPAWCDLLPAED